MSLTKVSFSMIQGPVFCAVDYGLSTTATAATNNAAINNALIAADAAGGGLVIIPPGTYTVSGGLGITSTAKICVSAYGAVLQQQSVNAQYNMFGPSSNMTIMGLSLRGYVASGTDWSNVQPAWSFGFRIDGSQSNVKFVDCDVQNIPYDGWLIAGTAKDIYLENCTGSLTDECYRNTIAIAPSSGGNVTNVVISGGKYGPAKGRPAIDLEPDSGGVLGYVFIGQGVHVTGGIDVIAGPTRVVDLDGVVFDGAGAYLMAYFCSKLALKNLEFINGAVLRSTGVNQGISGSPSSNVDAMDIEIGKIYGVSDAGNVYTGANLIKGSYNTFANWSQYTAAGASPSLTITPNVEGVGPTGAVLIDAVDYAATFTQTVAVNSGDYYTFGGYLVNSIGDCSVVVIEKNSGGSPLSYRTYRGNSETGKFCAIIKIDPNTTQVEITWGSHTTSGAQKGYFGALFLRRGLVADWIPSQNETVGPVWEAAPTTGTWAQGNVVIDNTPSASGYLGWVCTTGGTPGTWKTFGAISA